MFGWTLSHGVLSRGASLNIIGSPVCLILTHIHSTHEPVAKLGLILIGSLSALGKSAIQASDLLRRGTII